MYKTKKTEDGKIELWWKGETNISEGEILTGLFFDDKFPGVHSNLGW